VLGSGNVSIGEEYTIAMDDDDGDSSVLPPLINLTFYDSQQTQRMVQTNIFPTDLCTGMHYAPYSEGLPHTHVVEVRDFLGTTDLRNTLREESFYLHILINASSSPVPVRLEDLNIISNIFGSSINMTDAVNGIVLVGNQQQQQEREEQQPTMFTRTSIGKSLMGHSMESRSSPAAALSSTMDLVTGPLTIDLYWKIRYTLFGTLVGSNADDRTKSCNGFDFVESILGMA
jgi:hypothetical protein